MSRLASLVLVAAAGCATTSVQTFPTSSAVWKAVPGSWPALARRTEGLVIAPHSKWGEVSTQWADGLVTSQGNPIGLDGAQAHVVTVELAAPMQGAGWVVTPARVTIDRGADPMRALDDAAARWRRYVAASADRVEQALHDADRQSAGRQSAGRPLGPEGSPRCRNSRR